MMAADGGQVEVLRLLSEAGPDKNLADNDGSAALMMAALWRACRRLAFAAGGLCRQQPRHYSFDHGSSWRTCAVLRLLSEARADKNLGDNQGMTALMMAARGGHVDVLRLLLEAGDHKKLGQQPRHDGFDDGS